MKKVTAIILILVFIFSLSACGSKTFEGKYTLSEISAEGMDAETYEAFLGAMGFNLSDMTLEVRADGTATMVFFGDSQDITWTEKDGKYYFDVQEALFDGSSITFNNDGVKMVFKK